MTNSAQRFVSLLAKHAPATLTELREASLSSVGHVEDAIMDIRGDLDKFDNELTFRCMGWSKDMAEEACRLNGLRFAIDCALAFWPNMADLRDALLNSF